MHSMKSPLTRRRTSGTLSPQKSSDKLLVTSDEQDKFEAAMTGRNPTSA
jgi:hypothetical protein